MLQLSAAVASLTLVTVLDIEGLLGLGPAIVLASGALAALPAGRGGWIASGRVGGARPGASGTGGGGLWAGGAGQRHGVRPGGPRRR